MYYGWKQTSFFRYILNKLVYKSQLMKMAQLIKIILDRSISQVSNNTFVCVLSAIGRTLIPRYFRSIFEGGVTELYYNLKHPKESFHNTTITLDCDHCVMVTHHGKPMFTKVRRYKFRVTKPPGET